MIERIIVIDNVDPVVFYGVNNSNMQLIRNLFPKLRIAARGNLIKVLGDDEETATFEKNIKELEDYCAKYNQLGEDVILDVVKGKPPKELKMDDVIIYGVNGKPIQGRSANQQKLVRAFQDNDLTFALGPAGTGKTYVAIAMAVRALKNVEINVQKHFVQFKISNRRNILYAMIKSRRRKIMKANIEKLDRIINGINGGHLGTVELNINNIK